MYQFFSDVIAAISNFMYSYLLILLLLAAGIYFSFRTGFVQIRMLGEALFLVTEKKERNASVSAFEALMVSTASRVGTGNIVGVANAIAIGGYGAVFWMWCIALLGGALAFVECTLAQIYKKRRSDGSCCGGPSYYIEAALHSRWLGIIFAVVLIATYAVGFNMLCSYNLISSLSGYDFYGDPKSSRVPLLFGAALAVLAAVCVLGGGKRIVKVTGFLVPIMGIAYIAMAMISMLLNFDMLPMVFQKIFTSAFDFKAIFGGFAGSALMQGIKRGLYSNEAGVGSAPNAAAAADVSHPAKQGLVQMLSVFIDTILVCTATAMMCFCSGIAPSENLTGAAFVQTALAVRFGNFGFYFITVSLLLFAFTTLLGNLFYCESCICYIAGHSVSRMTMNGFKLAACVLIFLGALLDFNLVWNLADVLMGIMALLNLPVILLLSPKALAALADYRAQKKAGKDPVFRASSIGAEGEANGWEA